jgi:polysaccharide export outer membrane protein
MKCRWMLAILIFFIASPLLAQQSATGETAGLSAEDILLKQALNKQEKQQSPSQNLNERIRSLPKSPRIAQEYLLGPGDSIDLTVVGIPGLEKKEFAINGQGKISVPYLGEVEILGFSARDVESKLIRLFAVSLLEDPQVTVSIKEYRSQYYYVMGSVSKPGKYPLTQAADLLDALALAGGLTEKADPKIKLYRCSQQPETNDFPANAGPSDNKAEADTNPVACSPLEISVSELLEGKQSINRLAILSGDVIKVEERKEKAYYVLGDILKPGAYPIRPNERMALSQALANAGGMLRTASGKKMMVIRRKSDAELPERISMNAYALLKGEIRDIELLENDIVLVPGSASKTLGKTFMSGVGGIFTTLLLIGAR